jgi:hypothetical protein
MDPVLQEALAGAPATVTLGGQSYPLAYPIQGVILYKKATAALDRERHKASGRPALTREEKRTLREQRVEVLSEADAQRPAKGEAWDDAKYARFEELLGEALALKATLDEDAAAGDSLYNKATWWKISPEGDPERMLLALWVGLHKFEEEKGKKVYRETVTREDLGSHIHLKNGDELTSAIAKALRAGLIAPPETDIEPLPNAQPVAPAEVATSKK